MSDFKKVADLIRNHQAIEASAEAEYNLIGKDCIKTQLFGWIEKEWWDEAIKRDLIGKGGKAFRLPVRTVSKINKYGEKKDEDVYDLAPLTKFREDYENFHNKKYYVQKSFEGLT